MSRRPLHLPSARRRRRRSAATPCVPVHHGAPPPRAERQIAGRPRLTGQLLTSGKGQAATQTRRGGRPAGRPGGCAWPRAKGGGRRTLFGEVLLQRRQVPPRLPRPRVQLPLELPGPPAPQGPRVSRAPRQGEESAGPHGCVSEPHGRAAAAAGTALAPGLLPPLQPFFACNHRRKGYRRKGQARASSSGLPPLLARDSKV